MLTKKVADILIGVPIAHGQPSAGASGDCEAEGPGTALDGPSELVQLQDTGLSRKGQC